MPGRFIFFVLCLVVILLFAGFNIKNVSDISLGFKVFKEVPIFLSLLCAFTLGVVFCLPVMISQRLRSKNRKDGKEEKMAPASSGDPLPGLEADSPRRFLKGKKKDKSKKKKGAAQAGKYDDYMGSEDDLPHL
jgi:uncharacterized integral membrane protein